MATLNPFRLAEHRKDTQKLRIEDVSARAFLFLQEQAQEHDLPMRALLWDHLLGSGRIIKAVAGLDEAQNWLAIVSDELNHPDTIDSQ